MVTPESRIRRLNQGEILESGQFVLYWMTSYRRVRFNFALQRAIELSLRLSRPLLIFEAVKCDYPWASDRLHTFVLEGMRCNQQRCADANVTYLPYVEPKAKSGHGLVRHLASQSCIVVTDDFPCFFIPQMLASVASRLPVACEAVDSNGLYPMRSADRAFTTAHSFRRHLQKELTPHLQEFPEADPLSLTADLPKLTQLPELDRWPSAAPDLSALDSVVSKLPIDHSVSAGGQSGGSESAEKRLHEFITESLPEYAESRNHPDANAASGLSAWLHFGHVSSHEAFTLIADQEDWQVDHLADPRETRGSRAGWWGMSPAAEAFLDELVTWREIGFNGCSQMENFDQYDSLPDWARETLEKHQSDPRPYVYTLEEFQDSLTHDDIWNAAQRQLVREGRIHNYLRMLWGKKILEWTESPEDALNIMIELNNRFALDGRDPNSYSGIFWVLGRYDRAWGPERPIYGKVRYMTSDSTRRKLKLANYLAKYGSASPSD